ncbi:MAG TPA: FtsX-like permease family protein [Pseudonocardiaceae bacterium]|nr:FtsX-like permease family protein [Pseudonocardiaceae bacterium]
MAAYRTVLVTVLVITFLMGAVLAALAAYDARALSEAAYDRLAGADTAITVTAPSSSAAQSARQTSVVRSETTSALGSGTGTLTAAMWSNSENLPAGTVPDGRPTDQDQALLAGFGSLAGSAKLLTGNWPGAAQPDGTVPAAVPETVATSLRLAVGSTFVVKDSITDRAVRVRIVGTYRPLGARSAYALLDQIPDNGVRSAAPFFTYGPFDVDPTAFTHGLVASDQTAWDIQPSPLVLARRGPDADSAAIHTLTSALQRSATLGSSQVTTTLPGQLAALTTARNTARTELAGVALVLLTLTIAALIVTARPLGAQRETETYLLAMRGRSRRQAALANVGEAVTLGVVTMLAAAPAGTLLAVFLGRGGPLGTGNNPAVTAAAPPLNAALPPVDAWLAVVGVALFAAAILIVAAARKFSPSGRLVRAGRQSRLAGAARAGVDLAVLALAAAAYWQLRSLSSGTPVYALLVLAPALALLACALLCLRLLPLLAGLGDRLAARGRGMGSALAVWQISRRPRHHAGPALLIVFAVAGGTFALGQHATRQLSIGDQAQYAAGAQIRVDIQGSSFAPAASAAVAADRSVRVATPVIQTSGYNGSAVLAMDSRTASRTVLTRPDQYSSPPAALWAHLGTGAPKATTLPARPTTVGLTAALSRPGPATGGGVSGAQVAVTVEDSLHRFTQLTAQSLADDGSPHPLTFPIPPGADYPLRVAELSLTYLTPRAKATNATLTVSSLRSSAGVTALPLDGWSEQIQSTDLQQAVTAIQTGGTDQPAANAQLAGSPKSSGSGRWSLGFASGFGLVANTNAPAQVTLTVAPTAAATLPVLATGSFLASNQLRIGSLTQVGADGLNIPARIVGKVAAFPTISDTDLSGGLVVDDDALQYRLLDQGLPPLTATSYWLTTAGGAVPAGLPEGGVAVTTLAGTRAALANDPLTQLIQQSLIALGSTAGILAIAALWAAVAAARRERADQEAVLIALGISGRRQALLQAAEIVTVAGPAAVAGLAIGILISRLMLPYLTLTSAATIPVPSIVIVVSWLPSLILTAAMIVGPALAAALAVVATRAGAAARLRSLETA